MPLLKKILADLLSFGMPFRHMSTDNLKKCFSNNFSFILLFQIIFKSQPNLQSKVAVMLIMLITEVVIYGMRPWVLKTDWGRHSGWAANIHWDVNVQPSVTWEHPSVQDVFSCGSQFCALPWSPGSKYTLTDLLVLVLEIGR